MQLKAMLPFRGDTECGYKVNTNVHENLIHVRYRLNACVLSTRLAEPYEEEFTFEN
jgi:hypothetical protein